MLPGRRYTPDGPLLFFAAQVALTRGWDVRQVWWEPPELASDQEEVTWVGEQLDAAVEGYDGRVVVVAKSLGTLAVVRASRLGLPAAWLTPLLSEPDLAEALRTYPAPQLVAIGSDDPYLRRDVLASLPGERLLVPGDHVLRVPGAPAAMVESHAQVVEAFDAWLTTLPS